MGELLRRTADGRQLTPLSQGPGKNRWLKVKSNRHDAAWYSAYDAPAKRYLQGQPSPQPMVWKPSPLEPALGYPHRKALFQYCLIYYNSMLFRLFLCFRTSLIFLEPTVHSSCNLMGVCLWVPLTSKTNHRESAASRVFSQWLLFKPSNAFP